MGYCANLCTSRRMTHSRGDFNYLKGPLNMFLYELRNETEESGYWEGGCAFVIDDGFGGDVDNWEISREWLSEAVKYIKKEKKPEEVVFDEYTYDDILEVFEDWLEQTKDESKFDYPEWIYVDWY